MIKVLITGVTGQDGSYMVDYLLKQGNIQVYGAVRRVTKPNYDNIKHNFSNDNFAVIEMDVSDFASVAHRVKQIQPDYFINFAANSFVGNSWEMPLNHFNTNAVGVLNCLEAIRMHKPTCRFYNAGSSEEFGNVDYCPQNEKHPLKPRSPYGASKASARHLVKVYRESYGLYAVQGWLFNHESERRGDEFVTQKIAKEVVRITKELANGNSCVPMELGNLDAKRDWSHAEDFIDGIWRMLNQENYLDIDILTVGSLVAKDSETMIKDFSTNVHDYVLASGETHTVREFVEKAFNVVGLEGFWKKGSKPEDEEFIICVYGDNPFQTIAVKINPKFYRPAEVELLLGNSTKAREELHWNHKISFDELVSRMVNNNLIN